jgi:hypothetical protein
MPPYFAGTLGHGPLEKADVLDCDGNGPLGRVRILAGGQEAVIRARNFR